MENTIKIPAPQEKEVRVILCQGLLVDLDFNPRFKLDYKMIIIDRDFVDECPGILLIVFVKLA
jgi:hypothetical protein